MAWPKKGTRELVIGSHGCHWGVAMNLAKTRISKAGRPVLGLYKKAA
jgi:hypothetical protein